MTRMRVSYSIDSKNLHFSSPVPSPNRRFLPTPPLLPNSKPTVATCKIRHGQYQRSRAQAYEAKKKQKHRKEEEDDEGFMEEEEEEEEEEEGETRQVHCEVDVISWRERRIRARVLVHAHVDSVWNVLTDYERLANFIPNLVYSGRIPCPHQGRIWLEQRGLQQALYWHIEARVVLDLQEFPNLWLVSSFQRP